MGAPKSLPNILTAARIVLGVLVFFGLAGAAGLFLPNIGVSDPVRQALDLLSLAAFVIGALTDYFDGWLARKLNAKSVWGAILDPIADKIAVAAAVLGLAFLAPRWSFGVPAFLILFREFFVSGLREAGAGRGVSLPVTQLAKWKTTLQLVALALEILAAAQAGQASLSAAADVLLWIAAAVTLWTGAEYARAAGKALRSG